MSYDDPRALYHAPQLPDRWIAYDAEAARFVMWPARAEGWRERTPYLGRKRALVQTPPYNAAGTRWPGLEGGPRPGAGRPATIAEGVRVDLRVPAAVLARYDAEAERTGSTRAALMRAVLEREAPPN